MKKKKIHFTILNTKNCRFFASVIKTLNFHNRYTPEKDTCKTHLNVFFKYKSDIYDTFKPQTSNCIYTRE